MMKQRNILLITLMLTLTPLMSRAAEVPLQTAEQVARTFWNLHRDKDVPELTAPMQRLDVRWDAFYIFAPAEGTGFVVVAADDRVRPVLAYSFRNAAMRDTVGRDMAWWLDGWQRQMDELRNAKAGDELLQHEEWLPLQTADGTPRPLTALAPMVTTQWDQDSPYNDSCPSRSGWGGRVYAATGCVATAMAQVMKYWNYPERGTGTNTYYSVSISGYGQGFGNQTVDFGATVYDWENMPNTLSSISPSVQKAAVATLMYHCGVACNMIYGTAYEGGSGAFIHNIPLLSYGHTLNGMIKFFGYSSEATGVDRVKYDDSTWTAMVRGELDARRPIIYAGGDEYSGGHCFVCDGYDDENRYHFNWGWSGIGDGFYTLDHLAPGTGGTGGGTGSYDFTNLQQILVGIQPHTGDDSLCVIRQFPYAEDFETAPTCWEGTATNSNTYSWIMDGDAAGVDGKYSVSVSASRYGNSTDHMFSPAIVTPGYYKVSWQVRAFSSSKTDTYTFAVGTVSITDTVSPTEWQMREAHFSVAEGDTVRLDFGHSTTSRSGGILIDNVAIETVAPPEPVGIDERSALASRVTLYPNPTSGWLHISLGDEALQHVEVYEMTGRQVLSTTSSHIDLAAMPSGIYLLRVVTPSAVSVQRVVKK